jgi:hypothetical protein
MKRGLALLMEGELVFVSEDKNSSEYMKRIDEKIVDDLILEGKDETTLSHLNKRAALETARWNEAYHERLEGLRPIDIPISKVKSALMERMLRDFEKEVKVKNLSIDEQIKALNKFQREFILTPLSDTGEIPIVMIMREEEKLNNTPALKKHLNKYREETINSLYLAAASMHEERDIEGAGKRINAILGINPEYPFAKRLKRLLDKESPEIGNFQKPEDSQLVEIRTDILKPFFYDVVLRMRPFLRELLDKELTSLRTAGINTPITDDSKLIFIEEYLKSGIYEFFKGRYDIHEKQRKEALDTLIQTLHSEYLTILNFELFGKKVFYFAPQLVEGLTETELNVEGSLLRLPFPSCAFIYQDAQFIQLFHKCFGETPIIPEYDTPISVFLTECPEDNKRILRVKVFRVSQDFRYYGYAKRDLLIKDTATIEDALKTEWKHELPDEHGHGTVDDSFFYDDIRIAFFRTILNSILYLSSNNPDITKMLSQVENLKNQLNNLISSKKRAKLQRRIEDTEKMASGLSYILVGRHMEKTDIHDHYLKTDTQTWQSIMKRFMVRGHWRHQAYGRGLSERKLIWIHPHWKGPKDISEVINKHYIVE